MLRPIFEIAFAVLVGIGLELTITGQPVTEPPLQLAAAELGLDGYPAPQATTASIEIASLAQR